MSSAKSVGRIVGLLLLVQGGAGFLVNFVLLRPFTTPPGFLANAAASAPQVSAAVLVGLVAGALTLGVATMTFPIFRRYSYTMALWLLALSIVNCALVAIEQIAVRSMLSLSEEYARTGAANAELFQAPAVVVRSLRNWAHYTNLIVAGGNLLVLYGVLFRFVLVPRALAGFGMLAAMIHIAAVTMPLFGQRIVFLLLAPMGLSHLALALWLVVRGFDERRRPARGESAGVQFAGA